MDATIDRKGSQSLGELESCMWGFLEGVEAADLTIGKPGLIPLSELATVSQALKAFKSCDDIDFLSVWLDSGRASGGGDGVIELQLKHSSGLQQQCGGRYRCRATVSAADIVTFLARDEKLGDLGDALRTPLSALLSNLSQAVEHVHSRTSLYQASEIMLHGVQHLVVPISKSRRAQKPLLQSGHWSTVPAVDFCWITQEDVVRYMLSSVGSFYPLPMMSLEALGMINTDVMTVDADSPAIMAADFIQRASRDKTAVGVVTQFCDRMMLVGDISTETMRGCDETAAAALATLSVREFLQFVDGSEAPSHFLAQKVASGLRGKLLGRSCPSPEELHGSPSISSSDDDEGFDASSSDDDQMVGSSPTPAALLKANWLGNCARQAAQRTRAMLTCRPQSTLVAVMAQAVAHRLNHVWVTSAEGGLVGIVTYADMIHVLLS